MDEEELEDIAQHCAEYFTNAMTLKGWIGKAFEEIGVSVPKASDEDVRRILLRTIIQLYDAWEEDIEFEEAEDAGSEDEENEEEGFFEDEGDEEDDFEDQ